MNRERQVKRQDWKTRETTGQGNPAKEGRTYGQRHSSTIIEVMVFSLSGVFESNGIQSKILCLKTYLVKVIYAEKENQKFIIIVKAILLIDLIMITEIGILIENWQNITAKDNTNFLLWWLYFKYYIYYSCKIAIMWPLTNSFSLLNRSCELAIVYPNSSSSNNLTI